MTAHTQPSGAIDPFVSFSRRRSHADCVSVAMRQYDRRTGRPLAGGRDAVEDLSDAELEAELTIAAGDARRRVERLDVLLAERARRRGGRAFPARG